MTFARSFTATGQQKLSAQRSAAHLSLTLYHLLLQECAALHTLTPKQAYRLRSKMTTTIINHFIPEGNTFYTALANDLLPNGILQPQAQLYQWAKRYLFHNSTQQLMYHLSQYITSKEG